MPPKKKGKKKERSNYLSGDAGARDLLNAQLAMGFAPAETPITIPDLPAPFRRGAHLCAIHALTLSLNATRVLHEDPDVVPYTVREIALLLESPEYAEQVANIPAAFLQEDTVATYALRDYLDRSQITMLMNVINARDGTNYILGWYLHETGEVNIDGIGGPVVWIGHRGDEYTNEKNQVVDSRHFIAFTPQPADFDHVIEPELNRYNNTTPANAQHLVDQGLYRIIRAIPGRGQDQPAGTVGEFVFGSRQSNPNVPNGHIWARIGQNNGLGVGSVPRNHLEQVTQVTPRSLAPSHLDQRDKKRKAPADDSSDSDTDESPPSKKLKPNKPPPKKLPPRKAAPKKAPPKKAPPKKALPKKALPKKAPPKKAPPKAPPKKGNLGANSAANPAADNYDTMSYRELQTEVRERREADPTLEGPNPRARADLIVWLRQDDANKAANPNP